MSYSHGNTFKVRDSNSNKNKYQARTPLHRTSEGSTAVIYKLENENGVEIAGVVLKRLKTTEKEGFMKAKIEAELLGRLYSNVSLVSCTFEGVGFPGIVMPLLAGKVLQETEVKEVKESKKGRMVEKSRIIPDELRDLSFNQRADYIYQLYDQLDKIHAPIPPARSAILGDFHGGNIMIDFENQKLNLFDFGPAVFVDSSALIEKPLEMEENDIARSPERVTQDKIGLVSDIYGSITPMMLLLGARDPDRFKEQIVANKGSTQEILEAKFDRAGLLENFEPPNFINLPMKKLVGGLLERMQEKDPKDRIQTASELKEFWGIMKDIKNTPMDKATNEDYLKAAKLIAIAAGCRNLFRFKDSEDDIEECKTIVATYRESPERYLERMKKKYEEDKFALRYAAGKIIVMVNPSSNLFRATDEECKEIFQAYKVFQGYREGNPGALKLRLQLGSLLDELYSSASVTNQEKIDAFVRLREESRTNYLDINKTMTVFQRVCQVALKKEGLPLGESTTADKLRKLLDSARYNELVKCLSPADPKRIDFNDIYKFAGQPLGFFAQVSSRLSEMPTLTSSDSSIFNKPKH